MGYARALRTVGKPESFIYQTTLPLWRSDDAVSVAPSAVPSKTLAPRYSICGARAVGSIGPYLFMAGRIHKPSSCRTAGLREVIGALEGGFFIGEQR